MHAVERKLQERKAASFLRIETCACSLEWEVPHVVRQPKWTGWLKPVDNDLLKGIAAG